MSEFYLYLKKFPGGNTVLLVLTLNFATEDNYGKLIIDINHDNEYQTLA